MYAKISIENANISKVNAADDKIWQNCLTQALKAWVRQCSHIFYRKKSHVTLNIMTHVGLFEKSSCTILASFCNLKEKKFFPSCKY